MKRKVLLFVLGAAMLMALWPGTLPCAPLGSGPEASAATFPPGRLQVYVLNVERGQSVLVISPAGKAALIDAGPAEAGQRVVNELRQKGVRSLEIAVATQGGADYVGGMRRVAGSSDIVIKTFIDSAQPWKTDAYQQTLAAVQSAGIPLIAARRGQFYDLGGGARLDILNPAGDGVWQESSAGQSRENANGVVVRLLYREFAMLVMGGAAAGVAAQMLEARQNIWAPFLVVGDGGSAGSVSDKMLSIVQPRYAFISNGTGRTPAPETLELLKAAKAEIYRTETNGQISIISDGRKHEITSERKSAP